VESAGEVLETVVRGELGASVMSASVGATAAAEMGGTTTLGLEHLGFDRKVGGFV
jgi:hypothetical protein